MLGRLHSAWVLALVAACGSSADTGAATSLPGAESANTPPSTSTTPTGTPGDGGLDPDAQGDPLVGLWDVSGDDTRGHYTGQIEIRPDAADYSFIRDVHYTGVTVEGGRELHWLFRGSLEKDGSSKIKLHASLGRLDFIIARGTSKRTAADGPIPIDGSLTLDSAGKIDGTIEGSDIALHDTWSAKKPLPAQPIFVSERKTVPAHPAPTPQEKQTLFTLFADYHTLPVLAPYINRSEFQAAVHGHVIDPTDLGFYRKNPNALRVIDKVIDDISLAETVARADSYRYTLTEKTAHYEDDIEKRFMDPDVAMIPFGTFVPNGGYEFQFPSGDSALWTSLYLAGEVYRYEVTGEAKAKDNAIRSLNAMLILQEITGDWKHFARVIRKVGSLNMGSDGWFQGTGPYAGFMWLHDGNNDMIKGLYYGLLMGWELLCEGGKTGYESYCARIETNAKHLADDVELQGAGTLTSAYTNKLPCAWLAAVVTKDPLESAKYRAQAEGYWATLRPAIASTPVAYNQGMMDWSGAHLTSIGDIVSMYLAKRMNLGGDAEQTYRAHIDQSHKNLEMQRLPTWHLLKAALGTGAGPSSPFIANAVSRLVEAQYPKISYTIDRRITPEFCMSPYPGAAQYHDYMDYPQEDRTGALNSYPLFEQHPDVLYWNVSNDYKWNEGYEAPGGDIVHLYWFARRFGLLSAND